MSRKFMSMIALILMMVLTLTACNTPPASQTPGKDAPTQAPQSAKPAESKQPATQPPAEKVVINFEQYSGSGDNEQYLQEMIAAYKSENPNVEIKLQSYGYEDYFTQLMAKVAGGQAPDVFELNYENFVAYAKKGSLMPLGDLVAKSGVDIGAYNEMALRAFQADGEQFGVPNSFSNVVLVYNKDLFDQAGIDYPKDDWKWEDAVEAAKAIRALGDDIFGYFHPIHFHEFYKVTQQNGGGLFNQDLTQFTINTPANVETLQYLVDLQQKHGVMPTNEQMGGMGDWDLFKSGRLGMIITGIWCFPDFTRDCEFEWDIAVEPGHTQKATHFFSNGYVIGKDSKIAEEALKFMTFISSNKAATQIRLDAGWELPPVKDESIISEYIKKTPPQRRQVVFDSLNYLVTPPVIEQFAELQDIVGRHLSAAASGLVTPQQALDDCQKECEEKIALN